MAAETKIDEEAAAEMLTAGAPVRDVAHRFGVSTQAIYDAIRKGRLPARGDGGPLGDRMTADATRTPAASNGSNSN